MRTLKTFFALILLALAVSATSCSLSRKLKKAEAVLDANPTERARHCNEHYTPIEKTKTTVKYLPGKPIRTNSVEYVTVDCDSVVKATPKPKDRIVKVMVPVDKQVDTSAILQEVDRENVAGLAYRDSVIASKDRDLTKSYARCDKAEDKAANRLHWCFGLGTALLLLILIIALIIYGKTKL